MVTVGKPKGWNAKGGRSELLAVPPRALPVEDEVRVPLIPAVSKVVFGLDPYRTVGPVAAP
jgi:hypothetical protein